MSWALMMVVVAGVVWFDCVGCWFFVDGVDLGWLEESVARRVGIEWVVLQYLCLSP